MGGAFSGPPTVILREQNGNPRLWIGTMADVKNHSWMMANQISHLVNLSEYDCPKNTVSLCYALPIPDYETSNIYQHFNRVNTWIDRALSRGGNVLIYCISGQSRSVTIATAFLMWKFSLSYKTAFAYIHQRRSVASPNAGFQHQLDMYEKALRRKRERIVS